jgi:septum formation protein
MTFWYDPFMNQTLEKDRLILASISPRRKYLLEQAGIDFDVIPSAVNERSAPLDRPRRYTAALSLAKARDVAQRHPGRWVLGADTIVAIDDQILGKPRNRNSARSMLEQLSGQTHQVYTGFSICHRDGITHHTEVVATDVTFKSLSKEEIDWYIHTDEPFDKAGAYAIQGLGTFLVRRINGSYTNVVGLPVCEVIEYLLRHQVIRMPQRQ